MKKTLLSFLLLSSAAVASAQLQLGTAEYKGYSKYIQAVDEYVPAPGQFVNTLPAYAEGDDAAAMVKKCTEALANNKNGMITLGAYGGYVTFHFDHSVANVQGQKDLYITGNAMANGAEPGIVMVSKDVNGNGLPDDPWYELSGSADVDAPDNVVYNYEITYTLDAMQNVPWTDNQNNSGTVERNTFHKQEYFPLWLESPLTFKGTLLPKNAVNKGENGRQYWQLSAFRYGYVDNLPNNDIEGNSFDISWAVDADRKPVTLDAIDFVRVYSAENQMAGWLSETSTEVKGAEDLHLEASIDAQATAKVATFENITVGSENGHFIPKVDEDENLGNFTSGIFRFNTHYFPDYLFWSGYAVSNSTATNYTVLDDQYNNVSGGGFKSDNYLVCYPQGESIDVLGSDEGEVVSGFYVNNTAWVKKAIEEGDGMTPGAFTMGDWFTLTITGHKADKSTVNTVVYLADYTSENTANHHYINDWTWVDLSGLGAVTSLTFTMDSSHKNAYGVTTPTYFCMDNLGGTYEAGTPTAIAQPVAAAKAMREACFSVAGQHLSAPQRGLNIIRMSDGTVRKVMKR